MHISFRSVTVIAYKPEDSVCLERNQAVIYRGPFKEVVDDAGHVYERGARMAVCDRTYRQLQADPYGESFLPVDPIVTIPLESAAEFDCTQNVERTPQETKGEGAPKRHKHSRKMKHSY